MEDELAAHIRHLLLDYAQYHITTDYVQFTEAAVAELLPLKQIPVHDPASLTLPSDPFATLSSIHNLGSLRPHSEKATTTQDALLLLKKAITPSNGYPRSECLSSGRDSCNEREEDSFYRVEPILTRRAVRETPVLGATGGAHRAVGIQKVDRNSYARLMASKPILCKPVVVEEVKEREVKMSRVLDVIYHLKAADYAAVRALLQSVFTMCRPHPLPPKAIKNDYRDTFLPVGFVHDPPQPPTPPLDSPPLTPIFPRNARYRGADGQDIGLRSFVELPEKIGAVGGMTMVAADEDASGSTASDDSLARASMVIVDGWQTYAPSSSTTVSSVDEEFDELAGMFPSSPDTSVVDAINLIQDVENSKLDEVQIPKDRRIGESLFPPRESIVDKNQKAGGLGFFLSPLLKLSASASEEPSIKDLHPLLYDKLVALPRSTDSDSAPNESKTSGIVETSIAASQAREMDSMLGQTSAVSSFGQNVESLATEEDIEIRGLYQDVHLLEKKRSGSKFPLELADPNALIREEELFDEENLKGTEKEVKRTNEAGLRLQMMPVPVLPEPNIAVVRSVGGYPELLAARHARQDGKGSPLSRFLKTTKGMAPLRVALSWVPYTRTTPIPAHDGILHNDLMGEAMERREVDELLTRACGATDDSGAGMGTGVGKGEGVGFGDEHLWRNCSHSVDGDHERDDEFSAEVAKCEIILTRKEREALLARGRRNVGDEVAKFNVEVLEEESPAYLKRLQGFGQHEHDDVEEDRHRFAKRPRLSEDSGIEFTPEDRRSLDFDCFQDDVLTRTADNLLQDKCGDSDQIVMDDSQVNDDKNYRPFNAKFLQYGGTDRFHANIHGDPRKILPLGQESRSLAQARDNQQQSYRPDDATANSFESQTYGCYDPQALGASTSGQNLLDTLITDQEDVNETFPSHFRSQTQRSHTPDDFEDTDPIGRGKTNNDRNDRSRISTKASLRKLDPDLASHSLGIESFVKLRAKVITMKGAVPSIDNTPKEIVHQNCAQPPERMQLRTTPLELYDHMTIQLPLHLPQPRTTHKYMASINLLQKQVLVRSLNAYECLVELVERDSLGGVDLIIDPQTAIIFASLLSLPAHGKKLLDTLTAESWRYRRILIVFEAYPEAKSFRDPQRQKQRRGELDPELNAYTPPIVKAIKKFRRDMAITEGCGKKTTACEVWCAFANSVKEAANCARAFGDEAEGADWTNGALWGEREWLDVDASEDEKNLASLNGMNCFSALVVLWQTALQQFVDMSGEERLSLLGPLIGSEAIALFNADIKQRMEALMYTEDYDVHMS
ncbi:hypothetical protein H0H87_004229 [Tephrocybe sp. NHM501043]|nr:hypothetical protein H0H87_004229 [Tephrocybe sp. NHM501043]